LPEEPPPPYIKLGGSIAYPKPSGLTLVQKPLYEFIVIRARILYIENIDWRWDEPAHIEIAASLEYREMIRVFEAIRKLLAFEDISVRWEVSGDTTWRLVLTYNAECAVAA
jgi:hypothetical protein